MATKTTKAKDETTVFAQETNGQLMNTSGIGNIESPPKAKNASEKGDKNKKTTEGTDQGKEKAKNRRESSLPSRDADPDKSDPKSNRDYPKAEKTGSKDNKESGKERPKKKK